MPNWITSYVEIKGEPAKVQVLVDKCLKQSSDDDTVRFDFNGVIQLPEEIASTASPHEVVETQEEADRINTEWLEKSKASAMMGGADVRAISKGEAERRLRLYGACDWYEWSRRNWGTKWNAHDAQLIHQSPGRLVVSFDTAWSCPDGVFGLLEDDGFEVNAVWYDEDPSNHGHRGQPWDTFDHSIEHCVEFNG